MPAVPTGTVQLAQDGNPIPGAVATLDGSGNYSITYAQLPVGADNITAIYSGDSAFDPSVSPVLVQQVNSVLTTTATSLAATPNPSNLGQAVTFSGAVTASA